MEDLGREWLVLGRMVGMERPASFYLLIVLIVFQAGGSPMDLQWRSGGTQLPSEPRVRKPDLEVYQAALFGLQVCRPSQDTLEMLRFWTQEVYRGGAAGGVGHGPSPGLSSPLFHLFS